MPTLSTPVTLEVEQSIHQRILDRIKRNRISTTEIADCLDKTGDIPKVFAMNRGHFSVGPVFWVYAHNQTNWDVHEQVRHAPEGAIILVEAFDCDERAIFGQLVAKYLMLYRQAAAIVVQGKLRDIPHLIKENWPIWYEGNTPIGCFNHLSEQPFDPELYTVRKKTYDGAIAVCDDSGVVVITPEHQTEIFIEKLDWIEEQEDIWFDCIDRRKWDTYETICLKRYLNE